MLADAKTNAFKDTVETASIFLKNGPDPSARSWSHDSAGRTFAVQHKIPKQPLPSLESSCERYLQALKALQTEAEHDTSNAAVRKLLQNEGPMLQRQLEAYDESHVNWFEHFCYQAFLGDDSPVVLNSNAFASFEPDPDPLRNDQIVRATALVRSTVAFSQSIRQDQLPLDEFRGVPQCMNQYWWLFGVARVPGDDGGKLRMDVDARHIIVLCRGQMYSLSVFEDSTDNIISSDEIARSLQSIFEEATALPAAEAAEKSVGVLTTENQKTWSQSRNILVHTGLKNGRNFSLIDSSLFVLCLDESSPESATDVCKNMLCGTNIQDNNTQVGTCLNRWYDKLALIVCRNGAAGMNFEHTCTDGSVDIALACEVYKGSLSQPIPTITKNHEPLSTTSNGFLNLQDGVPDHTCSPARGLRKLAWDIPSSLTSTLSTAQAHLTTRIEAHQLATLTFISYGSQLIKSHALSPDAYFQMILQAAHQRLHPGTVVSGFEPILMRQYLHGRTDVARTTTPEAARWAKTFCSEGASAKEKVDALHEATKAHTVLVKECAKGKSHHRHLAVLQKLGKQRKAFMEVNGLSDTPTKGQGYEINGQDPKQNGEEDKTIFTDPGWAKLNTTVLMGSNVDNPYLTFAGFGPPGDGGFTTVYFIRKEMMGISVCSRNGEAEKFKDAIETVLGEVRALLEEVGGVGK